MKTIGLLGGTGRSSTIGYYTLDDLDAVVLGCTEYPLVVDETNSVLLIMDPVCLQTNSAVDYALSK